MKCPICHFTDTKVIDSRVAADGFSIRRRRECLKCNFRFSTYEEMEILDISILKRDGRKEAYNREKMVSGLKKALDKRSISDDDFKKLINRIERDIQITGKNEIPANAVGKIIMKHLRKVDQVAYIRFASVCESFADLQAFKKELDELLKERKIKKLRN
jgi:transcriptional repressor NrdR